LTFRPLGERGAYPDWLRALRGRSGAYAIREASFANDAVVYIGESHTGNLYDTITRHFQRKPFWELRFTQQHDPGTVYERSACKVAVACASPSRALEIQDAWIRRFKPRDNVQTTLPAEKLGVLRGAFRRCARS